MKKFKILFITHRLTIGGEQLSTLSLSKEIRRRGHNVYVLGAKGPLLPEFIANSINVTIGPVSGRKPWDVLEGACFIRQFIRKHNIQLIHSQSVLPTVMSYIARLSLPFRRIKIIWHDRGIRNYSLVKVFFKFMTDFIITNSAFEKKTLQRYGFPERKIKFIHNCYNLRLQEPVDKDMKLLRELDIEKGDLVIGTVGRLVKEKGYEYFINVAGEIIRSNNRKKVKFLIVGDGPLKSRLVNLSVEQGIEKNIMFIGFRNDIDRFYSIMDIFVLTSVYEQLGNVLLEAMFYEKPVVASKVGGVPEVVIDGENGFLVPAGDIEAFSKKITYLLDNSQMRRSMGTAGRGYVKRYFTPERLGREMEKIYEYLIG